MSELGWHMMAALVTYLYLGHVAVEAIGSRCHAQCITWPVHGRVVSLPWRCRRYLQLSLQMSRLWGQLYVDVSRVRLDSP